MNEHVVERAEAYWRRQLDADVVLAVERHLAHCGDCRAAYDSIEVAVRGLASWDEPTPIGGDLERRLLALRPCSRRTRRLLQLAAGVTIAVVSGAGGFVAGVRAGGTPAPATGIQAVTPVDTTMRTFLLLLEEPNWPPPAPLARPGYREWAQALTAERRYVGAEKLTEEPGFRIASDGSAAPPGVGIARNLSGWYLLLARDYDEAIAIARRGPHLRYGSILLRQLE